MGADMAAAACRHPRYVGGDLVPQGEWLATIESRIPSIRWAQRGEANDLRYLMYQLDPDFFENDEQWDAGPLDQREKDKCAALVRQAIVELDANVRELTVLRLGTVPWIVTGGMSWGDSPTEAFDWVNFLDASGIFDYPYNR